MKSFETINRAFNNTFIPNKLSIGIAIPIENNKMNPIASMKDHVERAQLVEELGFKALWVRDIPFLVPSFGDAGQVYEPFSYLSYMSAHTKDIALGIASVALPLHHPAHIAKAAATVDHLSEGRFLMGVASGDRPVEYPAMNFNHQNRGQLFRESFDYIRASANSFPKLNTEAYGNLDGSIDLIPKPYGKKIPMLLTGGSQQSLEWNASNSDGWINYPMGNYKQELTIKEWRELIEKEYTHSKPYMQSLFIDLHDDDNFQPQPIPLGFRIGANYLLSYFKLMQEIGVNHIALVLRFNNNNVINTLENISKKIIPHFN